MKGFVDVSLIVTAFLVVVTLLAVRELYDVITASQEFERRCAIACAPSVSITPVINGADSCLCGEGHGVWRHAKNVG